MNEIKMIHVAVVALIVFFIPFVLLFTQSLAELLRKARIKGLEKRQKQAFLLLLGFGFDSTLLNDGGDARNAKLVRAVKWRIKKYFHVLAKKVECVHDKDDVSSFIIPEEKAVQQEFEGFTEQVKNYFSHWEEWVSGISGDYRDHLEEPPEFSLFTE